MMPEIRAIYERLARLEEQGLHRDKIISSMSGKVDDMHDLMTQAKGAKWVLRAEIVFIAAITAWFAKLFPFFNSLPR